MTSISTTFAQTLGKNALIESALTIVDQLTPPLVSSKQYIIVIFQGFVSIRH
jgi:hypothetical protein